MVKKPFAGGYTTSDPDIVMLDHRRASVAAKCEICSQTFSGIDQVQEHYERKHFSDSGPASASSKPRSAPGSFKANLSSSKNIKKRIKKLNEFWYPAQPTAPPDNFTPGLIPLLKKALIKSHAKGGTQRAALCYEGAVHISRSIDYAWGCGYRNFMMACAALMDQSSQPLYFQLLDDPIPPGVHHLQRWIEEAWQAGFDREGAMELAPLVDTDKWIGTSDLWVAFSYRGIPSELVDFDFKKNPTRGAKAVTDWVVDYFSPPDKAAPKNINDALRGASAVLSTDKMPLILQHDGHSRTVVGYEMSRGGTVNLLVFDPSKRPNKKLRNSALSDFFPSTASSSKSPSSHGVHAFLHALPNGLRSRKRRASESPSKPANKRSRSDSHSEAVEDSSDEIEIIDGPTPRIMARKQDSKNSDDVFEEALKFCRIPLNKLQRKNQYQILYFTLQAPLTPKERQSRKEVMSTKVI